MKQKRIQGSHFASPAECAEVNRLIQDGTIKPVVSKIFDFEEIPQAHQLMHENNHPHGNMAVRVGIGK
jgi:crotonyl-CoA carboxylase/reductase